MKSQIFRDNIEDNEIRFLMPEDKDIIENKTKSKSLDKECYGR